MSLNMFRMADLDLTVVLINAVHILIPHPPFMWDLSLLSDKVIYLMLISIVVWLTVLCCHFRTCALYAFQDHEPWYYMKMKEALDLTQV